MTSQPGKQRTVAQILLNLSRSKGNDTVKFGQLLEESSTKCGEDTIPDPFYKINIEHISGSNKKQKEVWN